MDHRAHILACARSFLGTRFVHQGRSAGGLDCLGLLLATAQGAGLEFEGAETAAIDVPTYSMKPDAALLRQKLDYFLLPIPASALAPADVVLLKIQGLPQHLAILSDYPQPDTLGMIHAYAPVRKVVEHRYDASWQADTVAAYRLPQLN